MGSKVKATIPAPLDEVYQVLIDADYLTARTAGVGHANAKAEVTSSGTADGAEIAKTITVELESLPSFLKKMVDPKQVVKVRETWRRAGDGYKGDYLIEIQGQPITVTGVFTLMPDGTDGATYEVDLSCKAKMPLVGGQVAKFVLGQYVQGAKDELAYTQKHFS